MISKDSSPIITSIQIVPVHHSKSRSLLKQMHNYGQPSLPQKKAQNSSCISLKQSIQTLPTNLPNYSQTQSQYANNSASLPSLKRRIISKSQSNLKTGNAPRVLTNNYATLTASTDGFVNLNEMSSTLLLPQDPCILGARNTIEVQGGRTKLSSRYDHE